MRHYLSAIAVIAVTFAEIACGDSTQPITHGATTTAGACLPPCWNGITPGQTSQAEALEILELPPQRSRRLRSWPSGVQIRYINNPMYNSIEFDENGLVEALALWTDEGPAFDDVVNEFGEPQWVIYGVLNPGEAPWQRVGLLYPQAGLLFMTDYIYLWSSRPPVNIDMPPRPDMKVVKRLYFKPQSALEFEEWLLFKGGGGRYVGQGGRKEGNLYTRKWEGFGK
jgi:hypothetical protein